MTFSFYKEANTVMEVLRSKIYSINESACPGAWHLSSFFCPRAGHCHAFPAQPPGIVNLKKKSANARGMGNARIE